MTTKRKCRPSGVLIAMALTLVSASSLAQTTMPSIPGPVKTDGAEALSEGEVRRIDAALGRITLRHGPLKNLDMPPMTMVFDLRDKSMLAALKVGDKVRFRALEEGGKYVVTHIEAAR